MTITGNAAGRVQSGTARLDASPGSCLVEKPGLDDHARNWARMSAQAREMSLRSDPAFDPARAQHLVVHACSGVAASVRIARTADTSGC
jgi:hypothetical protein